MSAPLVDIVFPEEPLAFGVAAATLGSADEAHLLAFKKSGATRGQSADAPEEEVAP